MSDTQQNNGAHALAQRFNLAGKRALVTGGSLSIGFAISRGLAEAGADVAIHCSREADAALGYPQAAENAQATIQGLGRRAVIVEGNFHNAGAGARTVAAAAGALGGVDILVICASIQFQASFLDVTREQVESQFNVNFRSSIELLQAALPGMLSLGCGRIVSIGSTNQSTPNPHLAIYAALKAAQHNLIVSLAKEYAAKGVTANTLSPGLVATARNRWRREDAEGWARIVERINPMHRAGDAEEMVGAALLLCSDAGSFINGADIQVSGGGHL